jgi:polyphosphate glucokinase
MNVLVVDVGGTHVKVRASGQNESRQFDSGPALIPRRRLLEIQNIAGDWSYDVVSIGYPGPVLRNRPIAEPHNLGCGWIGFNFETASDIQ